MQAHATDGERLRIALVLEGGRSSTDAAALSAVAQALEQSGAEVRLIRHGLGRLSTLQVQRAVQQARPQIVVTTGVTSTRHLRRLAARLGCPLVCYFWPSATVIDPHRRPRSKPAAPGNAPGDGRQPVAMQRAVVSSEQQRADLLQALTAEPHPPRLSPTRIHVLPPLLDAAIFESASALAPTQARPSAAATVATASGLSLGVYGVTPAVAGALPAEVQAVALDGAPVTRSADASEALLLARCAGLLVVVHDAHDARDAVRRIAVALVLGKPVLLAGFGQTGCELPRELQSLGLPPSLLRAVATSELTAALPRFCAGLSPQAVHPAAEQAEVRASLHRLREALHPTQVLAEHVALLFEVADSAAASTPAAPDIPAPKSPSLAQHARALSLRFSRRPQRLILRYQAVVAELRGLDSGALITPDTLAQQLQTLLDAGYQPQPLSALTTDGKTTARSLAVTFDGGHAGVATLAAPLLQRLRIPFTVFVASDLLVDAPLWPWPDLVVRALRDEAARRRSLPIFATDPSLAPSLAHRRWPQQARGLLQALAGWPAPRRDALISRLRDGLKDHIGTGPQADSGGACSPLLPSLLPQLQAAGGELGSHGRSLSPFASLDDAALAAELAASRRALIDLVGRCESLAPPPVSVAASLDARTARAAAAAGYLRAVGGQARPDPEVPAPFALVRQTLCEQSSAAPDGTFDAHRLWLSLVPGDSRAALARHEPRRKG